MHTPCVRTSKRAARTAYSHRVHPSPVRRGTTSQVETEVADDAFLLALQAAEQQAERQAGGRGGAEGSGAGGASRGGVGGGGGDGGGLLHRRSVAAAEGAGWCGDGGRGGLGAPSALPEHPKRRRRFSEIHATDETHGAPPVGRPVDMRRRICPKRPVPLSFTPLPPFTPVPPSPNPPALEPPGYLLCCLYY